jgi:hypothetical protein
MPLPLLADCLNLQPLGQTALNKSKYLRWLCDEEGPVSLDLVDYPLNLVTQEKVAACYRSFADNSRNLIFVV